MKIQLGYRADEEYYAINEQGIRVDIDMLAAEDKKAMSPMQLLLSGVVSCAAVDLVAMVKKRRKTLVDFSGEIVGVRRDEIPKKFTEINILYTFVSPDLQEEEAQKLVNLAVEKYCSVASSLDPTIKMTHGVKIERPA
ncbi:MAG: osmotically inducible protein OsmC [Flammeovirgaceae bacterium]|nr:osmotically inducible protein OsmC [Flammeovirgaceae bacterium]HCX22337.1 osmotically inducible protein OsmC [Cytophagales bacterium]|tara:strand:+ start:2204 stop:2617 length:414 start_codon:yes stop_codon:yes gene_type:complete